MGDGKFTAAAQEVGKLFGLFKGWAYYKAPTKCAPVHINDKTKIHMQIGVSRMPNKRKQMYNNKHPFLKTMHPHFN